MQKQKLMPRQDKSVDTQIEMDVNKDMNWLWLKRCCLFVVFAVLLLFFISKRNGRLLWMLIDCDGSFVENLEKLISFTMLCFYAFLASRMLWHVQGMPKTFQQKIKKNENLCYDQHSDKVEITISCHFGTKWNFIKWKQCNCFKFYYLR